MKTSLSIVIPVFNEEKNLKPLYKKIKAVIDKSLTRTVPAQEYEIIFINDGSADKSEKILKEIAKKDKKVRVVSFVRNFGQTAALSAGFEKSRGEVIITLDADLQNDPADIPKVLAKINEGYDVISGWRKKRRDPFLRTLLSSIANAIISKATNVSLHDTGCTLKAYKKEFVKDLELFGEMHRFLPALVAQKGAKLAEVEVSHHPRKHGQSNYGLMRTFKVLLDLLTVKFFGSFATKPIYVFGGGGLVLLFLGFLSSLFILVRKFFFAGVWVSPMLFIAVLLIIIGVQFLLMGLLAEIQIRTYFASTEKPYYKVKFKTQNSKRKTTT